MCSVHCQRMLKFVFVFEKKEAKRKVESMSTHPEQEGRKQAVRSGVHN